ncbi:hypothetical protein E1B28_009247 [Marasmius oreades]|uniref:Nascent polypeptide-associated complex subunit alpha-like UBA domain-containing protein n=1 Tax=Marasmius oreades TaxID=181124 RepID=A0A9P7UT78_9AGAR|nr:uncharacterized protein E1B28_009247 [Marasmius oreades]KAG7092945.1 hypothetical protein E1B28_009247 [Marasmius oreades]
MSRSNGTSTRPEPEVIMNFADGFSYVKAKLDEAYVAVIGQDLPTAQSQKVQYKKEDLDLLINEFEISKAQAEKALAANEKDLVKTVQALIRAPE